MDTARSALATLKETYDTCKEEKERLYRENEEYRKEMTGSHDQLKKLEGVKTANQKLVGRMKIHEEETKELKAANEAKEKVKLLVNNP